MYIDSFIKMHISTLLLTTLLTSLARCDKVYQGFNSGAFFDSNTGKQKSDFIAEFKAAQALKNSPGVLNSVRLYTNIQFGTTDTPIEAFEAAMETNTTMLLGMWCSGTTSISNELNALSTAISTYGQQFADLVVGISVGSEDLYRASVSGIANSAGVGNGPDEIVKFINQTRATIANTILSEKPVGHVDSWSAFVNSSNSEVIDAADFLGADIYPYYVTEVANSIDNAATLFDSLLANVTASAGTKEVWITETGWPVSGPTKNDAVASLTNAQTFWDAVGCKLFGRTNTWWYELRDDSSTEVEKFGITNNLDTTAVFNITCPADTGAPATVNVSGAGRISGAGAVAFLSAVVVLIGLF